MTDQWYIALITFERVTDDIGILPANAHGAAGWLGVRSVAEADTASAIGNALREIGLRLVEIAELLKVSSPEQVEPYDAHLAANMSVWEEGKRTVWGTIHSYLTDGQT